MCIRDSIHLFLGLPLDLLPTSLHSRLSGNSVLFNLHCVCPSQAILLFVYLTIPALCIWLYILWFVNNGFNYLFLSPSTSTHYWILIFHCSKPFYSLCSVRCLRSLVVFQFTSSSNAKGFLLNEYMNFGKEKSYNRSDLVSREGAVDLQVMTFSKMFASASVCSKMTAQIHFWFGFLPGVRIHGTVLAQVFVMLRSVFKICSAVSLICLLYTSRCV